MAKPLDITGDRYGMLVAQRLDSSSEPGRRKWVCLCDCGETARVALGNLRSGHTTSCGCWKREASTKSNLQHGGASGGRVSPEMESYYKAKSRCLRPTDRKYPEYGGRGITMHPDWVASPTAFLEHMGPRPQGTSIDRIDNDRGYEPGNCRWATPKQQSQNRRPRRWQKRPAPVQPAQS